ncbi:ATP-binding SpoIIE family protein phosphatase [Streptomyces sp. C10-9-1]|uniref:ATP-binding SpoIIE family protein phosphatase n=1 Tax=Streptomyces sp. C10-9-1 TaxID=1859285 RepID=UPI003D70296B
MTELAAFLSEVVRGLQPQTHQLAEAVTERFRREVPEVWREGEDDSSNIFAHISAVLGALQQGLDAGVARTPPVGIEVARRFARDGRSVSDLQRCYLFGYTSTLRFMFDAISRATRDPDLIHAAEAALTEFCFEVTDRVSKEATAAYQDERDRQLRRRLMVVNEAGTRIGTTLDMTRTCQELADVGAEHLADLVTVDLLDLLFQEEAAPQTGPPLFRRAAEQSALSGCRDSAVAPGETHSYPPGAEPIRVLDSGQLARHAVSGFPPWLAASAESGRGLGESGIHPVLLVPLLARGNALGVVQFIRRQGAEAFDDSDLLLAREIVARAAVQVDNACRFTREHTTAATLQSYLQPQRAAEQFAVETASRYLAAGSHGGVGGDWFDVIPLSGARVAFVVGDVVGRGLRASATMGRLRTAVRAFADIDLMPDELLTHLDDVVIRLQREEAWDQDGISATCLYAVYDPVSGVCSVASAGHLPPAVVTPAASGTTTPDRASVHIPELPVGPPLGLGGLPFETVQLDVPAGSLLAFYTDGLLDTRTRDVDAGLAQLRSVLAEAPPSLEDTCEELLGALPGRVSDDVALLLARPRALSSGHVAVWDFPPDPAAVSRARSCAAERLAGWQLSELTFTTELVVSELVTNAIRYGAAPIQLRLILSSALTCEVSDSSSTGPHMRRARVFDEGGRGLLLVAQVSERWGTRYTREGKVIWAEQPLPQQGP